MRIALVIPSMSLVHAHFAVSLAAMMVASKGVEFLLVNAKGSIAASARNRGVAKALENPNIDSIMFLDSDMSFPPITLLRLIEADKPIVGCNYVMRGAPHHSCVRPKDNQSAVVSGITEVDRLPTGIMLIQRDVFAKLKRPWFQYPVTPDGEDIGTEDYYFCDRAREAGLSIWMDTDLSLEIVHWGDIGFKWIGDGYSTVEV